jgi:dihydroflavonol-4-reductase
MKVFVTGGNGFIGSTVVRRLAGDGCAVRCLVRPTSDCSRLAGLAWERAAGDVCQAASVRRAMAGCDAVIHLACISSWDQIDSPRMHEVTETGTRNVLDAAAENGGLRTVFVSSMVAVNGSTSPLPFDENARWDLAGQRLVYADAKRAAEALCRQAARSGLPVVVVNPAEVHGPNDTALVTAGNLVDFWKSRPVFVCAGGTSVVHVEDVADGIVRALERGASGERYILGGENLTLRELAGLTLDILGERRRIVTLPRWLIRSVARAGLCCRLPLPFNPRIIPYATRYWFADAGKARRELGATFRPARETLTSTLAWLKAAGHIH